MPIKALLWTPEQFNNWRRTLENANWAEDNGFIYFSQELMPEDVANVAFVQNARIFLATLEELGGTASTQTGNLNRQFVNLRFERLILSDHDAQRP